MYEIRVSERVARLIAARYGEERGADGAPSEADFWAGPLAAALIGLRGFDRLPAAVVPAVRTLHVPDPVFGAVVFTAVKLQDDIVEIADFALDPDYWTMIENHPDE